MNALNASTNLSFGELLVKFLFYRDYLRPASKRSYRNVIKIIQRRFPGLPAEKIDDESLIAWRNEVVGKEINAVTWNNYVRHLKAIYNVAIRYKLLHIKDNPFCGLFIREPKSRKKILTKAQLEKIDYVLQDETNLPEILKPSWFILCLVNTLRYTGIRCSQLIQLTIQDVNLRERVINIAPEINKNHTYHVIPISDKLYPHLNELLTKLKARKLPKSAQLFNINLFLDSVNRRNRRRGKLMSKGQITNIFRHLSDLTGFAVSPHRFRHTVATSLMQHPENVYVVQKLLGHKSISVTLGYIEHDVEMLRDSVNLL